MGPIGGFSQLGQLADQLRIGKHRALTLDPRDRVVEVNTSRAVGQIAGSVAQESVSPIVTIQTLHREGIHVIPRAHIDEHLPTILDGLEVLEELVDGPKGTMRTPAQLRRPTAPLLHGVDQIIRGEPIAHEPVRRRIQQGTVIREIDPDRGGAVRNEANQIPFMNQDVPDSLDEVTELAGHEGLQVQLVHEENDDPPRGVIHRASRWKDDALLDRRRWQKLIVDASTKDHHE